MQGDYRTSVAARLSNGSMCAKTDCVLIKSEDGTNVVAGQFGLFVGIDGLAVALVAHWGLMSVSKAWCRAVWRRTERPKFVKLSDILCSVIWKKAAPGTVVTSVPFQFQGLEAVSV